MELDNESLEQEGEDGEDEDDDEIQSQKQTSEAIQDETSNGLPGRYHVAVYSPSKAWVPILPGHVVEKLTPKKSTERRLSFKEFQLRPVVDSNGEEESESSESPPDESESSPLSDIPSPSPIENLPTLDRSHLSSQGPSHLTSPLSTEVEPSPSPKEEERSLLKKTPKKALKKSPYFAATPLSDKTPRSPGSTISCIPFPPLNAPHFGLIQEKFAHDPLKLLIAVTFLNRTTGKASIPIFYKLISQYPTAEALASANKEDIVEIIRHLGLQSLRSKKYIRYASTFLTDPPTRGKRYRVENYPVKGFHKGITKGEVLADESDDPREGAWEIGHLTQGPYAIDSWRIFCRDVCRGVAEGHNGEGAGEGFQPEWMRVMPRDKELRAWCRWMWLREGWVWDPETGGREVAGREILNAAGQGRVVWDERGRMRVLSKEEGGEGDAGNAVGGVRNGDGEGAENVEMKDGLIGNEG